MAGSAVVQWSSNADHRRDRCATLRTCEDREGETPADLRVREGEAPAEPCVREGEAPADLRVREGEAPAEPCVREGEAPA
ncbi:MAG: hypothetical protein ACE5E6_02145, partial [Phycisphaerae bacterium]